MNPPLCRRCLAIRKLCPLSSSSTCLRQQGQLAVRAGAPSAASQRHSSSSSSQPSVRDLETLLSKPTWSVRSLLPPSPSSAPSSTSSDIPSISPKTLHHLLRLSALPLPRSKEEESSMLATLHSQLHFVRAIQSVDTVGVPPLQAIRDETSQGIEELTIGVDDVKEALAREDIVGHMKRPRRRSEKAAEASKVEDWDALGAASRTIGRYFVVESRKDSAKGGE